MYTLYWIFKLSISLSFPQRHYGYVLYIALLQDKCNHGAKCIMSLQCVPVRLNRCLHLPPWQAVHCHCVEMRCCQECRYLASQCPAVEPCLQENVLQLSNVCRMSTYHVSTPCRLPAGLLQPHSGHDSTSPSTPHHIQQGKQQIMNCPEHPMNISPTRWHPGYMNTESATCMHI